MDQAREVRIAEKAGRKHRKLHAVHICRGFAMNASFPFVREDYLSNADPAFIASDLHLRVNGALRDNPGTAARPTQ